MHGYSKKNISNFWKKWQRTTANRAKPIKSLNSKAKKTTASCWPKLLSIRNWLSYQRIIEIGSQGTEVHKPSQLPWTWLPQPTSTLNDHLNFSESWKTFHSPYPSHENKTQIEINSDIHKNVHPYQNQSKQSMSIQISLHFVPSNFMTFKLKLNVLFVLKN